MSYPASGWEPGLAQRGIEIEDAVDGVAGLIEANRDASHGLRMMADILEDMPIAPDLRAKAEMRDGFASRLAVLMASYGKADEIPEGGSAKGRRFGWRLQIATALKSDDRQAVLGVAIKGNEQMQDAYNDVLSLQLPDNVRSIIVAQLREIESTGGWIEDQQT